MIRNPAHIETLASLIGPPMVVGEIQVFGPTESKLLDQIEVLSFRGITPQMRWSRDPARLSREERAAAILDTLRLPRQVVSRRVAQ